MVKNHNILVEDDAFTRLFSVILDPHCPHDRLKAFTDFMAHDEPDFDGWLATLRRDAGHLYPANVILAKSEREMRDNLAQSHVLVVESFQVVKADLEHARNLRIVQKFGTMLRNIDESACRERGIKILTIRRRANIACAEHAFALMLTLARRLNELNGISSAERLAAAGHPFRPYDRSHSPGGNFGRFAGLKSLNESTIGIIGLGEIGREIALRAKAFGMRTLYYQRTRAPDDEEETLGAAYVPLSQLLAESDWIIPQIPGSASTAGFLGQREIALIRPTAHIINISNANLIDRDSLLDALKQRRIAGFALDPLYQEPMPPNDELFGFKNVILSPHLAGSPRQNALTDFREMIINIAKELAP
jgi:phosphoglycerate dehydrogenase-like enzyme